MLLFFIVMFISAFNGTAIKILLPHIMVELNADINWLTWVVTSYALTFAILIPIFGRLGDLYGHRRFFILGLFIFFIGSLLCGFSTSFIFLIAARIVQAIGAGLVIPNAMVIMLASTTDENRGQFLGLWAAIGGFGAVAGPVLAGFLVDSFTWRSSFFLVAAALGIIFLFAVKGKEPTLPETENAGNRNFDFPGAGLLLLSSTLFLLAITLLPDLGLKDRLIQIMLISSILLLYIFFRVETVSSDPLINLKLFKDNRFSVGLVTTLLAEFVVAGTLFMMPIFFDTVKGLGSIQTSLLLTPTAISAALFSPVGGRMSDKIGFGYPISLGMALRAVSFFLLSQIGTDTSYQAICFFLTLNGMGLGMSTVPALNAMFSSVEESERGVVGGLNNTIRAASMSIGTTVCGIILYALLPDSFDKIAGAMPGFNQVFLFCSIACIPGIFAGAVLFKGNPEGVAVKSNTGE